MALQGTLDTFSVPDVLRLLASTRKRGRLLLHGTRGEGSVWLDDGRVVDVTVPAAPDVAMADALFEILRAADGAFAFEAGLAAPDGAAEGRDVEALLAEVEERVAEWHEIEALVPSLGAFVALNPALAGGPVTIDADTWKAVVAIAGGATVAELAGDLDLTEVAACRAVRDLIDLGIALCAPTPPEGWDDVDGTSAFSAAAAPAGGREPAATFAAVADIDAVHPVEAAMPAWDDEPAVGPVPAWDDAPAALAWAADPAPARWASGPAVVLPPAPAWDTDPPAETDIEPEYPPSAPAPVVGHDDAGPRDGWSNVAAWAHPDPDLAPRAGVPAAHDSSGLSPQAAHALAAVVGGASAAAPAEQDHLDDPGQRGLLVKFLSSVRP